MIEMNFQSNLEVKLIEFRSRDTDGIIINPAGIYTTPQCP